jgi:hypothetical protein
MDKAELMLQSHAGTLQAVLVIINALIAAHPNKAEVASSLRDLMDSDLSVIVSMRAAGMPKVDEAYRETMQGFIAVTEQHLPAKVRFPGFGTGQRG